MIAPVSSKLTVDGVDLAYEEQGEGPPAVLIHGLAVSSYSWREVACSLAGSHRVISLDLMGFGLSAKPKDGRYTLDRQASLLRDFIAERDLGEVALAGHSYGGGICLNLLRNHADMKVSRLVLVDTICYPMKLSWFMRAMRTRVLGNLCVGLVPSWLFVYLALWRSYRRPSRIRRAAVCTYARYLRSPGARHALLATVRNIIPDDSEALISSYRDISVPTLIVWGEHDTVIPISHAERLSLAVRSAGLSIVDDCGHSPQEELPERVAEVMGRFLSS